MKNIWIPKMKIHMFQNIWIIFQKFQQFHHSMEMKMLFNFLQPRYQMVSNILSLSAATRSEVPKGQRPLSSSSSSESGGENTRKKTGKSKVFNLSGTAIKQRKRRGHPKKACWKISYKENTESWPQQDRHVWGYWDGHVHEKRKSRLTRQRRRCC